MFYSRYLAIALAILLLVSCTRFRENKIRNEYCQLKTQADAYRKFLKDQEKGTLRYFYMGYTFSADKAKEWKARYNIRIYNTGKGFCQGILWYNQYVEEYLAANTRKCCIRKTAPAQLLARQK